MNRRASHPVPVRVRDVLRRDGIAPLWLRLIIAAVYLLSVACVIPRRAQRWLAQRLATIVIKRRTEAVMKLARATGGTVRSGPVRSVDTKVRLRGPIPPRNRRERRAQKSARGGRSGGARS